MGRNRKLPISAGCVRDMKMNLIQHDSSHFSLGEYEFLYFHNKEICLEMGRRSYIYAPTIKAAIKYATEALKDIGKYRMRVVAQHLTARHSSHSLDSPSGIVLDSIEGGWNYDQIHTLYLEDELIPGKHVFAIVAHWEDWGGTFNENTNEVSIVGLTYDQAKATDLVNWLNKFGNCDPDYSTGGYAPWQGYGSTLHNVSISLLPVV